QQLASIGSAVVFEVDARARGDVHEPEAGMGSRPQHRDCAQQQRTAGHGKGTRPVGMAEATHPAVFWVSRCFMMLARCTATVFTLRSNCTAISLFDLPSAINCRISSSRVVRCTFGPTAEGGARCSSITVPPAATLLMAPTNSRSMAFFSR